MQNHVEVKASCTEVRVLQFSMETEAGAGTLQGSGESQEPRGEVMGQL